MEFHANVRSRRIAYILHWGALRKPELSQALQRDYRPRHTSLYISDKSDIRPFLLGSYPDIKISVLTQG